MWKSCGNTWSGVLGAQALGEKGSHTCAALSLWTQLGFYRTLRINSYERKVSCWSTVDNVNQGTEQKTEGLDPGFTARHTSNSWGKGQNKWVSRHKGQLRINSTSSRNFVIKPFIRCILNSKKGFITSYLPPGRLVSDKVEKYPI